MEYTISRRFMSQIPIGGMILALSKPLRCWFIREAIKRTLDKTTYKYDLSLKWLQIHYENKRNVIIHSNLPNFQSLVHYSIYF